MPLGSISTRIGGGSYDLATFFHVGGVDGAVTIIHRSSYSELLSLRSSFVFGVGFGMSMAWVRWAAHGKSYVPTPPCIIIRSYEDWAGKSISTSSAFYFIGGSLCRDHKEHPSLNSPWIVNYLKVRRFYRSNKALKSEIYYAI